MLFLLISVILNYWHPTKVRINNYQSIFNKLNNPSAHGNPQRLQDQTILLVAFLGKVVLFSMPIGYGFELKSAHSVC